MDPPARIREQDPDRLDRRAERSAGGHHGRIRQTPIALRRGRASLALTIEARAAEGGEASVSESAENQPYAGPGRETDRRQDMPDDHADAEEFVAEVDEEAPDERLQERVRETFAEQRKQSDR
jgi:hypothetical protein